jgi:hypothetical protein
MGMAETSPGDSSTPVDSSQGDTSAAAVDSGQADTSMMATDSSTPDTGTGGMDSGQTDGGAKDSGTIEASTVCLFSNAGSLFGNCTFAP